MNVVNKKAFRALVLDRASRRRGGKFTRVSGEFMDDGIDHLARVAVRWIDHAIDEHPSIGKTLKGGAE